MKAIIENLNHIKLNKTISNNNIGLAKLAVQRFVLQFRVRSKCSSLNKHFWKNCYLRQASNIIYLAKSNFIHLDL